MKSDKSDEYANKINNYQYDCNIILGKYQKFSHYMEEFSKNIVNDKNGLKYTNKGLDIGIGPGGYNAKYFSHCQLDGCDVSENVLNSAKNYHHTFLYNLGRDILPYAQDSLDFVVCSCVVQHLNSFNELEHGINEISHVLKYNGMLYLMFKIGNNDTILSHYNGYYREKRKFRVYEPDKVSVLCARYGLFEKQREIFLDDNWIPYCCLIVQKK